MRYYTLPRWAQKIGMTAKNAMYLHDQGRIEGAIDVEGVNGKTFVIVPSDSPKPPLKKRGNPNWVKKQNTEQS